MSFTAFRRFSKQMLGVGVLTAAMLVAACGSSSNNNGGSTSTTQACSVSSSDLQFSGSSPAAPTKNPNATGSLQIDGSTALQPLFKNDAQAPFDQANGTTTNVGAGGSGTGLKDVEAGSVQIGMADFFASEKATTAGQYGDLQDHQVAAVAFAVVVNKDIGGTITNLTTDQIKKIYDGTYTNWTQVSSSAPNEGINVVVRTSGSGTRFTFDKYVLGDVKAKDQPSGAAVQDSTGQLVTTVGQTAGSIGYVATGFVINNSNPNVTPVCIDSHKPTLTDINAGNYKFWSIEHAYTKGAPTATAQAFLDYVTSDGFQTTAVPKEGFLQIKQLNSSAITSHTPSGS